MGGERGEPSKGKGMNESEDLALFAGDDESAAGAAFERLSVRARRFLFVCLRERGVDPESREDVVQEALARIWRSRSRYHNQGVAAWYGLLRQTAFRCYLDMIQARGGSGPVEFQVDDLPEETLRVVDTLMSQVSAVIDSGKLQNAADALWLEVKPGRETTRRLLAAQLYYLDGEPWDRVLRLLPAGSADEPPLSRSELDDWLTDPGTLRLLAYHTLYYSNDELAAALLAVPDAEPVELAVLMRRALAASPTEQAGKGWTWGEVRVILWRYRYGLLVEQILSRGDCSHDPAELAELLVRTLAQFPFSKEMERLVARLEGAVGGEARRILATPGLWQRLAFQYRYADELPHRDIGERLEPAAGQVDYRITPAMLNIWLAGRRLLTRFADFCEKKGLVDADE